MQSEFLSRLPLPRAENCHFQSGAALQRLASVIVSLRTAKRFDAVPDRRSGLSLGLGPALTPACCWKPLSHTNGAMTTKLHLRVNTGRRGGGGLGPLLFWTGPGSAWTVSVLAGPTWAASDAVAPAFVGFPDVSDLLQQEALKLQNFPAWESFHS